LGQGRGLGRRRGEGRTEEGFGAFPSGRQNKGLGNSLLKEIEKYYPDKRFKLFTNSKNKKNVNLYLKNRYKKFKIEKVSDSFSFILFEK
jgi:hypothetical protein